MIDSVTTLLMTYFPDSRPVKMTTLKRKCLSAVIDETVEKDYLMTYFSDGETLCVITEKGRQLRNK